MHIYILIKSVKYVFRETYTTACKETYRQLRDLIMHVKRRMNARKETYECMQRELVVQ
jgi:thiosulfate reductase cytochrome b subunit